ncbi:MAG: sigma-54-dependent Fis family transcriptional regulator [bacterium]|nr:sigma-54-dependent Fis family transcriptional regulator [bacterium]
MDDQKTTNDAVATDGETSRRYEIAGSSDGLMEVVSVARKVAPTSAPVLITGESGTGKELVSCLIHGESDRADAPYIYVNCAAISESLLESELFGHEKGAFTGAHERRAGRFERADGGTLLLDEISETTPKLQAELLRVLEQQDFERVGGSETVKVNVRILSTSNRNLAQEVTRGKFRKDLYYRLGGIHLFLPPLRDRCSDIQEIIWHFVNLYASETNRQITKLDKKMLNVLEQYDWPGNIRQLRNVIRTALILGEGTTLSLDGVPPLGADFQSEQEQESSTLHLREIERRTILEALRRTQRNQVKAASLLGISDRTLREKLRRYKNAGQLQPAGEM